MCGDFPAYPDSWVVPFVKGRTNLRLTSFYDTYPHQKRKAGAPIREREVDSWCVYKSNVTVFVSDIIDISIVFMGLYPLVN
jgi:hypothetical protein